MIEIKNINGRPPERIVSFRQEHMWVTVEQREPGRFHVRMENALCSAMWLQFDIVIRHAWNGQGWSGGQPCDT